MPWTVNGEWILQIKGYVFRKKKNLILTKDYDSVKKKD